jgi:hypothetical protein
MSGTNYGEHQIDYQGDNDKQMEENGNDSSASEAKTFG